MGEGATIHDLVIHRLYGTGVAQAHVVLDSGTIGHVRVTIEEYLRRQIIQLPLSLLILGLLAVTDGRHRAAMADDLGNSAILWQVAFLGLLSQKLVLVFEPSHFEEGFAVINDDVITHFDVLGELRILHSDERLVPDHLLFAVEKVLLACLDLHTRLSIFEVTETDAGPLQVNVYAALLAGDFCCPSYHLDQNFMLLVLDLSRIDPTYVHTLLQ